jgi:hypothetical protein
VSQFFADLNAYPWTAAFVAVYVLQLAAILRGGK